MKDKLPKYLDCKNEEVEHCEWYMHKSCPETCAYSDEIRGIGVGAMSLGLVKLINKEVRT